ncbi:MAG: 6-phosphogluconolactonase [Gammaproteobacteria bacterium]|nr:6-phosphogluconolactonase [Gammaproteobacteria bacterium]
MYDAPKPPPERVSLSLATLQSAGQRIVLVSGSSKHGAMTALRQGEPLPVNRIGAAVWFVDQAAYNNQQDIE